VPQPEEQQYEKTGVQFVFDLYRAVARCAVGRAAGVFTFTLFKPKHTVKPYIIPLHLGTALAAWCACACRHVVRAVDHRGKSCR